MARPRFRASEEKRKTVRALAGFGLTHDQIARMIGIRSPKTLRKYFERELANGSAEANAQVAQTLYKMATSGTNPGATIFWLKTRAKWSEKTQQDHKSIPTPPLIISQESGQ